MAEPARVAGETAGSVLETWRRLNFDQRVAAVGSLLLIVSTFGPFSFVEAAIILTAVGVLTLLRKRADRRRFHLPFGDGTAILAAGLWSGLLIVVRLFDRPLGQSVLAFACAAILAGAGAHARSRRPADDLAELREPRARGAGPDRRAGAGAHPETGPGAHPEAEPREGRTVHIAPEDAPTERRRRPSLGASEPPPEAGDPHDQDAPTRRPERH